MRHRLVVHVAVVLVALIAGMVLAELGSRRRSPRRHPSAQDAGLLAATSTFMDNFKMFADRIKKASGGRLEIETLPAGAMVPAFEVVDATIAG